MRARRYVLLAPSLMWFVACAGVPKELTDARAEYDKAKQGPAARIAPAQLHDAEVALQNAEKSYNKHGDSEATRDLAYVALRRTEWAEAEADTALALSDKARAQGDAAKTQARMGEQTVADLTKTREALREEQQKAQSTQEQLATERAARFEAEKRADDALQNLAKLGAVKEDARGKIITLPGGVLFASGKSDLLSSAYPRLDDVVDALKKMPDQTIKIEGYTDSRGSEAFNRQLSERRTEAVRAYLVKRGVPADRISTEGRGKADPVADNSSAEGRAMNRRVEIILQTAKPDRG